MHSGARGTTTGTRGSRGRGRGQGRGRGRGGRSHAKVEPQEGAAEEPASIKPLCATVTASIRGHDVTEGHDSDDSLASNDLEAALEKAVQGTGHSVNETKPGKPKSPQPPKAHEASLHCASTHREGGCSSSNPGTKAQEALVLPVPPERRAKVLTRLTDALGGDELAKQLATDIESTLFVELSPGPRYHRQARALIFNLRGKDGADFRAAVRARAIPATAVANLHTEDMASTAKREERVHVRQEAMEACDADWELRRETVPLNGMFSCGKCGGNSTWYFQFQTRACDEPMEFFVMCRECHHGWRHNEASPDDIFRQVWSS